MPDYPSGTVAFLFTDIEGSTKRWESSQHAMHAAVERHIALLRAAIAANNGVHFKTIGDAVQAAFPAVSDAVAAAVAGQAALRDEDWGELGPLRVRMAVHVGEATPRDGDYLAQVLNRLARVLGVGYGEQVLLTEAAEALLAGDFPAGHELRDLGAHRLKDLLVAERIYQLTGPGLPAEFPPLKSLDRQPHNLPAQPTPLIGREDELAALKETLTAPGTRLLTLTGPGGTGKTRLALQAAADVLDEFTDGVWWVPLAAVTDPDLVADAIAAPLGVREVPGEPLLTTLGEHLRSRRALLLLDNLEQVVAAAPMIAGLLDAAPQLVVLATSRAPLRLRAEREHPVDPLPLPAAWGTVTPEVAAASPAVRLFVERAQAVKPSFALDEANAADVAAICRRLDGLPLAIELAAARVRMLSPAALLARLDQRLAILTGGARDLPERQQTLRAAIAWSHDLLASGEQELFARLAVFAGGCTFEAAEAVASAADGVSVDLFDGLDSLVQKSLVRQEETPTGDARFAMLQTIREFGLERLDAGGETDPVRQAHAGYFLTLAEEAEPKLTSPEQADWLDHLESEHDNIRAALGWLERLPEGELWLRLTSALWRFWWMRGHFTEGRGWLERALREAKGASPAAKAPSLSGAGVLAESQGDYERATELHQEALALWRQEGDRIGEASALSNLGLVARILGDYDRATKLNEQALAIWRQLSDERSVAGSLHELGTIALNRGDYAAADDLLAQSLALSRTLNDAVAIGAVLESLGILAFYQERYDQAASLYNESLAIWRTLDDTRMIANSLVNVGEAVHHQGDLATAEEFYSQALALYRELGEKRGTAFALFQLGKAKLARDDAEHAASLFAESLNLRREVGEKAAIIESLEGLASLAESTLGVSLFAAAETQRVAIGAPLPASYAEARVGYLTSARQSLGESTFTTEWNRGKALTLDHAISMALSVGASREAALLVHS